MHGNVKRRVKNSIRKAGRHEFHGLTRIRSDLSKLDCADGAKKSGAERAAVQNLSETWSGLTSADMSAQSKICVHLCFICG